MSFRHRRFILSPTPSLQSIASSADVSVKEELLPQPSSLVDCDDQLETYQILVQSKAKKKLDLIEDLKQLRSEKEPLLKVKITLQEEITSSNLVINSKSEEVTQLKNKLRHHSEKQIQDNIERLEFQLRNNNYKPREEQKILDEIFVLRRSVKTLKEFDLKQRENKKYRSERARLIDQRNEVFSKIQAIILQEEEIKKEVTEIRHIISSTKKTIDHLKSLRPSLEKVHIEEQRQKEENRLKRQKEKARARKEQYIIKQQERQKRWEEYEASIDPFEEEKDLCKMLLAYLSSALPSTVLKVDDPDSKIGSKPEPSPEEAIGSSGSFYCKPKYTVAEKPKGKKKKARAKKEQKAYKVRELSHPPDVLTNLGTLNVAIPRTTEEIPNCIILIQVILDNYNLMNNVKRNLDGENEELVNNTDGSSCIKPSESSTHSVSRKISDNFENIENTKGDLPLSVIASTSAPVANCVTTTSVTNYNTLSSQTSRSYFSVAVPVVSSSHHKSEPSHGPTYASVAARIKV